VAALGATTRFKRGMLQIVDKTIGLLLQGLWKIKVIVDLSVMNHVTNLVLFSTAMAFSGSVMVK
jgi:hypothetical protein